MSEWQADRAAASRTSRSPAPIIWITGLAGTGKTTLASAVQRALAMLGVRAMLLDGDAVRHALDSPAELARHDYDSRLRRAGRMAQLARVTALRGVPAIVATISLIHAVQAANRGGPAPYCEVLLEADVDLLRQRNPELYGSDLADPPPHVVGLDIVPEFPLCPELVIEQRFQPSDLARHTALVVALWWRMAAQATASA